MIGREVKITGGPVTYYSKVVACCSDILIVQLDDGRTIVCHPTGVVEVGLPALDVDVDWLTASPRGNN